MKGEGCSVHGALFGVGPSSTTRGPSWGYSKVNFDRIFRKRGRFSPNVNKNVHERPPDTPTKGLLWLLRARVMHVEPLPDLSLLYHSRAQS